MSDRKCAHNPVPSSGILFLILFRPLGGALALKSGMGQVGESLSNRHKGMRIRHSKEEEEDHVGTGYTGYPSHKYLQ